MSKKEKGIVENAVNLINDVAVSANNTDDGKMEEHQINHAVTAVKDKRFAARTPEYSSKC